MSKKKETETEQTADLSFEESLTELQQIVDGIEEGTLGLEESMRQFERGIALLRHCYAALSAAEQKIEILTAIDEDGNPLTEPFDASATADQKKSAGRRSSKKKSPATDEGDDDKSGDALF